MRQSLVYSLLAAVLVAVVSTQCIGPENFADRQPKVPTVFSSLKLVKHLVQVTLIQTEQKLRELLGYDTPIAYLFTSQFLYSGSWTSWDEEKSLVNAMLQLSLFRQVLTVSAVFDTSTHDQLRGATVCTEASERARTTDGTCNDRSLPLMGAAGSRFGRNMPNDDAMPDTDRLFEPNPRLISNDLLGRREDDPATTTSIMNLLAVAWIQFNTHDWFAHGGDRDPNNVMEVPLPDNDPLRSTGIDHLSVMRTNPDTTSSSDDAGRAPTYQNQVTHWWDASQIYGSDQATQDRLRSGVDGKLVISDESLLPEFNGRSDSGFVDNWWVGLELMHTLFVLEHNAICDKIRESHPDWGDQRLFDVARLVNAALIAKIHTVEWTPAILPNPTLEFVMNVNWNGINDLLSFSVPSFLGGLSPNLRSVLFGLRGSPRNLAGHAYALTEEFVAVYRFHQLVPDELTIGDTSVRTNATRNTDARTLVQTHGWTTLTESFGRQESNSFVLHNYPDFLRNLDGGPHGVLDLATIDVLRDRERGIPRYNEFRRNIALKAVDSFLDLTRDEHLAQELSEIYHGDVELIDLQVGMAAEGVRPECYGFGETAFHIFILGASYRLQKDRFFTDDYRPEVYTPEGLDWIDSNNLKSVLRRHFLAGPPDDIGNAFMVW